MAKLIGREEAKFITCPNFAKMCFATVLIKHIHQEMENRWLRAPELGH